MIVWLRLIGAPVRQFYRDADALPYLDAADAKHGILGAVNSIRSAASGETPNVSVFLKNTAGQASALFPISPLGVKAEIHTLDGVIFAGTIAACDIDNTQCQLDIAA